MEIDEHANLNGFGEKCYNSGGYGHYSRECPDRGKGKGKSKSSGGKSFGKAKGKASTARHRSAKARARATARAKSRVQQLDASPAEGLTTQVHAPVPRRVGLKVRT